MKKILFLVLPYILSAQAITYINEDTTWSGDESIAGKVVVQSGATLTIAPGTVVKAAYNANSIDATALVVARGGKIEAAGT
ncbi:MAG: hypothetical protein ACPGC2_02010, partial [Flavobacteriaceae bacterium]